MPFAGEISGSNTKTKGEFSGFRIRTPRYNKVVAALPVKSQNGFRLSPE